MYSFFDKAKILIFCITNSNFYYCFFWKIFTKIKMLFFPLNKSQKTQEILLMESTLYFLQKYPYEISNQNYFKQKIKAIPFSWMAFILYPLKQRIYLETKKAYNRLYSATSLYKTCRSTSPTDSKTYRSIIFISSLCVCQWFPKWPPAWNLE